MERKESNFYKKMQEIGQDLSKRKTLAGQLMRELELSQYGFSFTSGVSPLIEFHEKELKIMKELEKKIEEQTKKVEKLNKFSEHMHFLDDNEIVEIYEVIHNEEKILKEMKEKLSLIKKKLENNDILNER